MIVYNRLIAARAKNWGTVSLDHRNAKPTPNITSAKDFDTCSNSQTNFMVRKGISVEIEKNLNDVFAGWQKKEKSFAIHVDNICVKKSKSGWAHKFSCKSCVQETQN